MTHSIVLPLFNHAAFVEEALMSCYEQDYDGIELVVIDDFSRDDSYEIAESLISKRYFKSRFCRVSLLRNPVNRGSVPTIVRGLNVARGRVLHILNTDDIYDRRRISAIDDAICDLSGLFWGFSSVRPIDEGGVALSVDKLPASIGDVFDYYDVNKQRLRTIELAFFERNIAISSGNLFFSGDLKNIWGRLVDFRYCADWLFCICAMYLVRPTYLGAPLLDYRVHSSNSFSSLKEVGEDECDIIAMVCEQLFLSARPINEYLSAELSQKEFVKFLDGGFLSVAQRQAWRGHLGVGLLSNFEYVTFASRLREFLNKINLAQDHE